MPWKADDFRYDDNGFLGLYWADDLNRRDNGQFNSFTKTIKPMTMSNKRNQVSGGVAEPSSSEESKPRFFPEPTATAAFDPEMQSANVST